MKQLFTILASLLLAIMFTSPSHALISEESEFLPADEAFVLIHEQEGDQLFIQWEIAPDYYLYHDKFSATLNNKKLSLSLDPEPEIKQDPYFGKVGVYHHFARSQVTLPSSGTITLRYQGCADAGLCYPPVIKKIDLQSFKNTPNTATEKTLQTQTSAPHEQSIELNSDSDLFLINKLQSGNLLTALFIFFGAGLITAFAGCSYPMFPILSNIILGEGEQVSRMRAFSLSLAYVLPISVVYALLGVFAGLFGKNLSTLMQTPVAIMAFVAILVAMAVSMFGVFNLQMPAFIQNKLDNMSRSQKGGTYLGAVVMGTLSAFLVSACTVPPIVAAISYIVQSGNVLLGAAAMFLFGLGLGTPLLILGLSASWLLPKAGAWMSGIQKFMAIFLIAAAIYVAARVLPQATTYGLWIFYFIALGIYLLIQSSHLNKLKIPFILAGLLSLAGGVYYAQQSTKLNVDTNTDTQIFKRIESIEDLQNLIQHSDKPVIVDFYATWCVSCVHMEHNLFNQAAVKERFKHIHTLQIDITEQTPAENDFMKQYNVIGAPAILMLNSRGDELRELRVTGEMSTQAFVKRLDALLKH